jgi:hypothetical protein
MAEGPVRRSSSSERVPVLPGSRLGPYEVLGEVGKGGMGTVFRGRTPDGRTVAIKLLTQPDSRSALDRFAREARLLASVGGAGGFVPLLDTGDSPSGPYLVMPFLAGGTLEGRLRFGRLDALEVVALGRTLGTTLGNAHAAGVVHRDVKPANVLFGEPGEAGRAEPLLADLGLAKHYRADAPGASQSIALSKAGDFRGTLGYMAPEQLRDARDVGPAADVFALGATLFECLAGEPPFRGDTAIEIIDCVLRGRKERLARLRPDAPGWLVAVVERALETEAEARYADGHELAQALAAGSGGLPGARRGRRIGVALAVAVGLGAFALVASRRAPIVVPAGPASPGPAPPATPVVAPVPTTAAPSEPKPGSARRVLVFTSPPRFVVLSRDPALMAFEQKEATGFQCLALAPDGAFALAGRGGSALTLWNMAQARERMLFVGHAALVSAVSIAPDGKTALSTGDDATLRLWTVPGGETLAAYAGHYGPVSAVAYSPDGTLGISGGGRGADRTVRLWPLDAVSGPVPLTAPRLETSRELGSHGSQVVAVGVSRDGTRAFSVERRGIVTVWDVKLGRERFTSSVEPATVAAAAFSADGRRAVLGTAEGPVIFIDLEGASRPLARGKPGPPVTGVGLSPDGTLAVTTNKGGALRLWDLAGAEEVSSLTWDTDLRCPLFPPEGTAVIAGMRTGTLIRIELVEKR